MRALDLAGLATGARLAEPVDGPLVIPHFVARADAEAIIDCFQLLSGRGAPLPRVEVGWDGTLGAAEERLLGAIEARCGAEGAVAVLRVREPESALRVILKHPAVKDWAHVAVVFEHPTRELDLRTLGELAGRVEVHARQAYAELADALALRPDGWAIVAPLVAALQEPVGVMEAANLLIEVQLEGVARPAQREILAGRFLSRRLARLPEPELIALLAASAVEGEAARTLLGDARWQSARRALEERNLLDEAHLQRWATLLEEPELRRQAQGAMRGEASEALARALEWLGEPTAVPRQGTPISTTKGVPADVERAHALVSEGYLEVAEELIGALEPKVQSPATEQPVREVYWRTRARLEIRKGRQTEAVDALLRGLRLADSERASAAQEAGTRLAAQGHFIEAEAAYREALRLRAEKGAPPPVIAESLAGIGQVKVHQDEWDEAAPLLRKALRLSDPAQAGGRLNLALLLARGTMQYEGDLEAASVCFREAVQLSESEYGPDARAALRAEFAGLVARSDPEAAARLLHAAATETSEPEIHRSCETTRAELLIRLGQGAAAADIAQAFVDRGDGGVAMLALLGRARLVAGEAVLAETHLRDALTRPEPPWQARRDLGLALMAQGRLFDAEETLWEALSEQEACCVEMRERGQTLASIAGCLAQAGLWAEAELPLQEALELVLDEVERERCDYSLAVMWMNQGRSAAALDLLETACANRSEAPEPWISLGFALLDSGRFDEGVQRLEAGIERLTGPARGREEALVRLEGARRLVIAGAWEKGAEPLLRAGLLGLREGGGDAADVMEHFGQMLRERGLWRVAEPLLKAALDTRKVRDAPKHERVRVMVELVRGLKEHGSAGRAETLLRDALALKGPGTPPWLSLVLHELALLRLRANRADEAEAFLQSAPECSTFCGEASDQRASTAGALAIVLQSQGRWSEAEPLFLDALATELSPALHGTVASAYSIGLVRHDRWAEAEPLLREAITRGSGVEPTPQGHIGALTELAAGLAHHGRWDEAEPLFLDAIRLEASARGRSLTLDRMARVLRDQGRWERAEPLFRQSIRLADEAGDSPKSRARVIEQLARGLRDHDGWAEAEGLFVQAVQLKEHAGDRATSRGITFGELARGLYEQGRWSEAERAWEQAIELLREREDDSISLGRVCTAYAMALHDRRRRDQAEHMFDRALEAQAQGGESATIRALTLREMGRLLAALGRRSEAHRCYEDADRFEGISTSDGLI